MPFGRPLPYVIINLPLVQKYKKTYFIFYDISPKDHMAKDWVVFIWQQVGSGNGEEHQWVE